MKFINGKLIDVGHKANGELILSYDGKLKPQINIDSGVELKESGMFFLNLTYKIEVLTSDNRLLNSLNTEYNFQAIKEEFDTKENKDPIYKHLQQGLTLALRMTSGNNAAFVSEALNSKDLLLTTETISNALIRSHFYDR